MENEKNVGIEPMPDEITLCLSGGGYRAAIFHLGALRFLNQAGVLPKISKISSVSGGSIISGHLAYKLKDKWPINYIDESTWNETVSEPFWEFVNKDVRTWPLLNPYRLIGSWRRAESLRKQYKKKLLNGEDIRLIDLPKKPLYIFCSTDVAFGVNWEASHEKVGDYQAGYLEPPPAKWTLDRAIAASSCFPPLFPPAKTFIEPEEYRKGAYAEEDKLKIRKKIRLTDGGVYDNLGLQPALRDNNVLVSNGGGALSFSYKENIVPVIVRYTRLLQNGIGKLRRQWLMRDYAENVKRGAYWVIGSQTGIYNESTAKLIESIRTDLNRFTRPEFEILENHGYKCCEENIKHAKWKINDFDYTIPNCDWCDEGKIKKALKYSKSRLIPYILRVQRGVRYAR